MAQKRWGTHLAERLFCGRLAKRRVGRGRRREVCGVDENDMRKKTLLTVVILLEGITGDWPHSECGTVLAMLVCREERHGVVKSVST